jgi:hypothetical protein
MRPAEKTSSKDIKVDTRTKRNLFILYRPSNLRALTFAVVAVEKVASINELFYGETQHLFYHQICTVKPVYNGHPWDLKKVAV